MHRAIAHAGTHRVDRRELRREHDFVERALRSGKPARRRPGARDVARPALRRFGADVGEQQIVRSRARL